MDGTNEPNWLPLTTSQMPPEILHQWQAERPDGSVIRNWVITQIETQLRFNFSPDDWTIEQSSLVQKWLWFQFERGDFFHRRHLNLETILHGTLTGKIWTLGQRHCSICSGSRPFDPGFPVVMPIRIAPESRQTLNTVDWVAFQKAIKTRFPDDKHNISQIDRLCLAFTFGLCATRNDRDLDNMAKSIQDAFSRAIGFNDRHVHHLDLIKIVGDFREEYVIVRVTPSYLNDHSDTLTKGLDPNWGGHEPLHLPRRR